MVKWLLVMVGEIAVVMVASAFLRVLSGMSPIDRLLVWRDLAWIGTLIIVQQSGRWFR